MTKILLTGAAGFIGMHVAEKLLSRGDDVVGLDNLNDYYDVALKKARLRRLEAYRSFRFHKVDVADRLSLARLFAEERPTCVLHLAAQVGVRYSVTNPYAYADSNLLGFINVLEGCRNNGIEHFVFASSSSIYGGNTALPFSESQNADHPVSLYAATKKANELMAHSYSHLYAIPATGLRFFTVYGPWGRPDMALSKFAHAIVSGRAIDVFNNGQMSRDFTYVGDVAESVVRVLNKRASADANFDPKRPNPACSSAPYRVFNVGNSRPVMLMDYIGALEQSLGIQARTNFLPPQPGDMMETCADASALEAWIGYLPSTPVSDGIREFAKWFKSYYEI